MSIRKAGPQVSDYTLFTVDLGGQNAILSFRFILHKELRSEKPAQPMALFDHLKYDQSKMLNLPFIVIS